MSHHRSEGRDGRDDGAMVGVVCNAWVATIGSFASRGPVCREGALPPSRVPPSRVAPACLLLAIRLFIFTGG
ncbi:MAG TPA: hypothetical protein VKR06_06020, partial [Ktedonosporobacter sp.]|nr:hypothetical protein [Ktedonosporobacter sp.]